MKSNHIRYANCHEDVSLLLKYVNKTTSCLSIASSLDNSLMLLTKFDKVYAIDSNENQISLCKLKIEAIKMFDLETFKKFYGFTNCSSYERVKLYNLLKPNLDYKTTSYFDKNIDFIKEGLTYSGKFEKYLVLFAKYILPLTNSKAKIKKFMSFEDVESQFAYFEKTFCNFRFKMLFKIFFSKYFMKKLGRDKECFTYVNESISTHLLNRITLGFKYNLNKDNCYMHLAILSKYNALPSYVSEDNYYIIKERINNLVIIEKDIREIKNIDVTYDFFNLSDIFEYMSCDETSEVLDILKEKANDKARLCYWNMINRRKLDLKMISNSDDLKYDRALFYTAFYCDEVNYE